MLGHQDLAQLLAAGEVRPVSKKKKPGMLGIDDAAAMCGTTVAAIRIALRRGSPYFPPPTAGGDKKALLWDAEMLADFAREQRKSDA